jgi:lipase maturation factor 1
MDRPTFLYDGDCGFCRQWIDRFERMTGSGIVYRSYQEAGGAFPQISRERLEQSVHLIDESGKVTSGAEAVFRVLSTVPGKDRWLKLYQGVPGFRAASEFAYKRVANHRTFFSRALALGRSLKRSRLS